MREERRGEEGGEGVLMSCAVQHCEHYSGPHWTGLYRYLVLLLYTGPLSVTVRHSQLTLATHCIITDNMKFNLFRHIKDQEDDSPFITSSSEYKYLPRKFRKGKTKSSVEYSEPRHRKSGKLLQGRIFEQNRK